MKDYRAALAGLKKVREGAISALDIVQDDEDLIQEVDENEFARLKEQRTSKGFIVDDEGGDYVEDDDDVGEVGNYQPYVESGKSDLEDSAQEEHLGGRRKRPREDVDLFNEVAAKRRRERGTASTLGTDNRRQAVLKNMLAPKAAIDLAEDDLLADMDQDLEAEVKAKATLKPKLDYKSLKAHYSCLGKGPKSRGAKAAVGLEDNPSVPPKQTHQPAAFDAPPPAVERLNMVSTQEGVGCDIAQPSYAGEEDDSSSFFKPQMATSETAPPVESTTSLNSAVREDLTEPEVLKGPSEPQQLNLGEIHAEPGEAPIAKELLEAILNGNDTKVREELPTATIGEGLESFHLDINDVPCVPFYFTDIHEVASGPLFGQVLLFGKVVQPEKVSVSYSCALVVPDTPRNVYLRLHKQPQDISNAGECRQILTELAPHIQEILKRLPTNTLKVTVCKRKLPFCSEECIDPEKLQLLLKMTIPGSVRLPHESAFKCEGVSHVFGVTRSLQEALMVKRRIMGPGWMLLRGAVIVPPAEAPTNTALCLRIPSYKMLTWVDQPPAKLPVVPPLTALSLSIKAFKEKGILKCLAISMVALRHWTMHGAPKPNLKERAESASALFVSNKMECPPECLKVAQTAFKFCRHNLSEVMDYVCHQVSVLDPDVILGHDLYGIGLGALTSQLTSSGCRNWVKLGRLRRAAAVFPSAWVRSNPYELGQQLFTGRLICDLYKQAPEVLGSKTDYTLKSLVSEVIADGEKYSQLLPSDQQMFDSLSTKGKADGFRPSLRALSEVAGVHPFPVVFHGLLLEEGKLSLQLMLDLQILQLTLELSQVAGSVWNRSLFCQRAERNEYLLLHAFRKAKMMPPEPTRGRVVPDQQRANPKKKPAPPLNNNADENDDNEEDQLFTGAGYEGGLVLEPISGLYDTFILYLDFASLYPSIIQEFNLCFTTCRNAVALRADSTDIDAKKFKGANEDRALLPTLLASLVQRRRAVKAQLRLGAEDAGMLDVRQKAIKLIANSIYGSLGFQQFRFYAPHIAATTTAWGRHILMMTKDRVERQMGCRVVYGDTDSLMVDSGIRDDDARSYYEALEKAQKIVQEVNKHHTRLELEVEAIFKKLLLLRKKKYAALKIVDVAQRRFVKEIKGVDIVRRDWCKITKDIGHTIIDVIFSANQEDDPAAAICEVLERKAELIRQKQTPLQDYAITKALNKLPSAYATPNQFPHVAVAAAMQAKGAVLHSGLEISYVICKNPRPDATGTALSDRAWDVRDARAHKQEPDEAWYLKVQILPPVLRLCQYVPGITKGRLSQSLGMTDTDAGDVGGELGEGAMYSGEGQSICGLEHIKAWMAGEVVQSSTSTDDNNDLEAYCLQCQQPRPVAAALQLEQCAKCSWKPSLREACDMTIATAFEAVRNLYRFRVTCTLCVNASKVLMGLRRECDDCKRRSLRLDWSSERVHRVIAGLVGLLKLRVKSLEPIKEMCALLSCHADDLKIQSWVEEHSNIDSVCHQAIEVISNLAPQRFVDLKSIYSGVHGEAQRRSLIGQFVE